jgi:hypothetical protein
MRRTLIRSASVGAVAALVMAVATGSALAAQRHGRFGVRGGVQGFHAGGFGPGHGGGFGFGQFGGRGPRGFVGGVGGPGGPGGGILASDVLTPAAAFLNVSVSTLTTDLAGGKTLAQEATAKGKTAADLITAIVAAEKTNLDNEKAAGWITADQETSLVTQLTAQVTRLVNDGPPVPPSSGGKGTGGPLQLAATFLGFSVSDLQTALKGGKTLVDEATAQGKTVADLVTALEAPAKANLDKAVTDGKITQAQETAILAGLTTRITNLVNGTKPTAAQMNSVKKAVLKYATLKKFGTRH